MCTLCFAKESATSWFFHIRWCQVLRTQWNHPSDDERQGIVPMEELEGCFACNERHQCNPCAQSEIRCPCEIWGQLTDKYFSSEVVLPLTYHSRRGARRPTEQYLAYADKWKRNIMYLITKQSRTLHGENLVIMKRCNVFVRHLCRTSLEEL
jgi:hypothetical protein